MAGQGPREEAGGTGAPNQTPRPALEPPSPLPQGPVKRWPSGTNPPSATNFHIHRSLNKGKRSDTLYVFPLETALLTRRGGGTQHPHELCREEGYSAHSIQERRQE